MNLPSTASDPHGSTVTVSLSPDGWVATVTLNRPHARNALDRRMTAELAATLAQLGSDPNLRAVVVTGAGDRAFSTGADLRERRALSPPERSAHTIAIEAAVEAAAALPMPTVAAIGGFALAGGAELALACDLRVAASDALLGFPEVRVGVFPGAGGILRLPSLIGDGAARDLLLTGRLIDAAEAHRLGLVDRLVPHATALTEAHALASTLAANAPLAVRAAKAALAASGSLQGDAARQAVARHRRPLDASADYEEGLTAFADRRPPRFVGR
jgi:enoyl-CoA hydratase